MKNIMKKVRGNKQGFTLAELLVVVAIVGILVAISIPVFTAQLGKARKATNQANLRAAKAAAIAEYLTGDKTGSVSYNYDIKTGVATACEDDSKRTATTKVEDIDNASSKVKYGKISVVITETKGSSGGVDGSTVTLYSDETETKSDN